MNGKIDPARNTKADNEKSTEKIDWSIATIMGLDRAIRWGYMFWNMDRKMVLLFQKKLIYWNYKSLGNLYLKLDKNKSLGYNVIKKKEGIVCCVMRES